MSRLLLDCEPLCGLPWRLARADCDAEREEVFRLRHQVFCVEQGCGVASPDGRDTDRFDAWCDHLTLRDEAADRLIATYRLIPGPTALRNGGFYSDTEFDLAPMAGIAGRTLEVGRTCVAPEYRNGLAMQFLWYGLELLLQQESFDYLLGCGSFHPADRGELNVVHSFARTYAADPEFYCRARPRCRPGELTLVPTTPQDEQRLPPLIRGYLKLSSRICSEPAWDPDFRTYDLLILFRRNQTNEFFDSFVSRMERQIRLAVRRGSAAASAAG